MRSNNQGGPEADIAMGNATAAANFIASSLEGVNVTDVLIKATDALATVQALDTALNKTSSVRGGSGVGVGAWGLEDALGQAADWLSFGKVLWGAILGRCCPALVSDCP